MDGQTNIGRIRYKRDWRQLLEGNYDDPDSEIDEARWLFVEYPLHEDSD